MKATAFMGPGKVEIQEIAKPAIKNAGDAIIKVIRASVCGSDLWWFRGLSERPINSFVGHEAIGIVEDVGDTVTNIQKGDFVIVPFTHGCGHCAACLAGFDGNCLNPRLTARVIRQSTYAMVTPIGLSQDSRST